MQGLQLFIIVIPFLQGKQMLRYDHGSASLWHFGKVWPTDQQNDQPTDQRTDIKNYTSNIFSLQTLACYCTTVMLYCYPQIISTKHDTKKFFYLASLYPRAILPYRPRCCQKQGRQIYQTDTNRKAFLLTKANKQPLYLLANLTEILWD